MMTAKEDLIVTDGNIMIKDDTSASENLVEEKNSFLSRQKDLARKNQILPSAVIIAGKKEMVSKRQRKALEHTAFELYNRNIPLTYEELAAENAYLKKRLKIAINAAERAEKAKRYFSALSIRACRMRNLYADSSHKQFMYNELILANSPDIMYIMDDDRHVLAVTVAFYRYFGYSRRDICVCRMEESDDAMGGKNWQAVNDFYLKSEEEKKNGMAATVRLKINDSLKTFDIFISRIVRNDFKGYVVTMNDVTEINDAKSRAESADRAKSDFLANMSHEIRTPVNVITGMAESILRESEDDDAKGSAKHIKRAAYALLAIINDVCDISKIEAGKLAIVEKEYNLANLLSEVLDITEVRLADKPIDLITEIEPTLPCALFGDKNRLRQVLLNLLDNAAKFTNEGFVEFKIKAKKISDEAIRLYISVADSGIGIQEEELPKIFQSFTQIDSQRNRSVDGTGLGLAISYNLVRMMGGEIAVESEYGKGTTFSFDIPQRIADGSPLGRLVRTNAINGKEEAFINSFTAPEAKVLIVDDNQINLMVAEIMLKPYGCQVIKAAGGNEAIDIAKAEDFDIIFMDHMMPVVDGVEAMQAIRRQAGKENAVIVALTANAVSGSKERYLAVGFQGYLSKPIEAEKLEKLLDSFLPAEKKIPQDTAKIRTARKALAKENKSVAKSEEMPAGFPEIDDTILHQIYIDGKKKCPLLRDLLENGDYERYTIEVHALKSVAALIGEKSLSKRAKQHEEAGKADDISFIREDAPNLLAEYEALVKKLEARYGKEEKPKEKSVVSDEEREERINKLKDAIGSFDILVAAEILDDMISIDYKDKNETIAKMKDAADSVDMDALEELAKKL